MSNDQPVTTRENLQVDRLEEIITDDLKRVYRTEYFQPKALLFCIGVDFWLGTLIFGPLIFIAFRGSWQCWDFVIIQVVGCGLVQSIMTTVMGCLIMTLIVLTNVYLQDGLTPGLPDDTFSRRRIIFFLVSRAFVLLSVSGETLMWKGLWEVLDMMRLLHGYHSNVFLFITLALVLLVTKSFNVCHCSPLGKGFSFDIDSEYLKVKTALQYSPKLSIWFHLLDAFLTVLLNLMTSCVYHSLWTLVEFVKGECFNADDPLSTLNVIIFGLLFSLIGFLLQFPNLYIHSLENVHSIWKFVSHEIMLIVTLVADIVVFHTIWTLLDELILSAQTSQEVGVLRMMKITGTRIFKHADEEYKNVDSQSSLNATIDENCRLLENRLALGFYKDLTTYLVSFAFLVIFRVSSTILCGVKREGHRYEDGIMVPRYYLTYILSNTTEPS